MYESDDIVGITFSEFAFFVIFILILLLVVSVQGSVPHKNREAELAQELDRAQVRIRQLEKELSTRPPATDLRSRMRPSCIEKGLADGFLFRATILSSETYAVTGLEEPVTFADLKRIYAAQIAQATRAECVQSVEVAYGSNVSLREYDHALKLLEQQFYSSRLGAVPEQ